MSTYGYARSAAGSTEPQEARLRAEGCAEVYADHGPSAPPEGSGWVSLLGVLAPGDTVRVVTADRLGRRAGAFLHAGEQIRERGAQLVVEGREIDTSTPQGRFLVRTMATFSEYEQALADEYGAEYDTDGEAGVMSGQDSTPRAAAAPIPPLETEQQARELPQVRAVYEAFGKDPGTGKMTPHNMRILSDAMAAAGVPVGAYDVRIAEWLAGQEPQVCAAIAGWIMRAAEGKS